MEQAFHDTVSSTNEEDTVNLLIACARSNDGTFDGDIATVSDDKLICNDIEGSLISEDSALRWSNNIEKEDKGSSSFLTYRCRED